MSQLTEVEAYDEARDIYQKISTWSLMAEMAEPENQKVLINWIFGTGNIGTQELGRLALQQNKQAIKGLILIIESILGMLDTIARQKPELLEPHARKKLYWPAFISNISETKKSNEKLLKILNLGKDTGLNISGKQPNWASIETTIALELFYAIKFTGRRNTSKESGQYLVRIPMPPLTRENYKDWFAEAWPLFISRWGKDYENKKQFSHYWENNAYKGKSNARALIRDAIYKKLKQSFRSIAAKPH